MAYLLGNKACMESLQTDVQDVHWTVTEIISRVGPLQVHSWKFPDKKACDLDIDDLLDLYDFDENNDDPEAMQVAHIALYELVIDRLILLLQAISKFCVVSLSTNQEAVSAGQDKGDKHSGSIGIVVKQHWSLMLQTVLQKLQAENQSKKSQMTELKKEPWTTHSGQERRTVVSSSSFKSSQQSCQLLDTPGTLGLIPPNTADVLMGLASVSDLKKDFSVSKDTYHKSSQTYETAFVACESCDIIQKKMREGGEIIIKVCQDQGLPCALKKFRSEITHVETLTFNDVCRWMVEQNKDIVRVGKQIEILQACIDPLKKETKLCSTKVKTAEDKYEKTVKEQAAAQTILLSQYEEKLKDQEKLHKELMLEEERQKRELKKNKDRLEQEMKNVMLQLEEQKDILKNLEMDYESLESDLEEKKKDSERASQLEEEVSVLKSQLADVSSTLENHSKTLAREQGKSCSAVKHNEFLQAKQETLLAKMEQLNRENENLSQQVVSLEEEKNALEESLTGMKVEMKELHQRINENKVVIENLESIKKTLEQSIEEAESRIHKMETELQEAKERERMILDYPDLNGPVNLNLEGTGDIAMDMSNQVTSNSIRIKHLEEQNQSLLESIQKITALNHSSGIKKYTPVLLWPQASSPVNKTDGDHSGQENARMFEYNTVAQYQEIETVQTTEYAWRIAKSGGNHIRSQSLPRQEFLVAHGPRDPLLKGSKSPPQEKPASGKSDSLMVPVNTTPIAAYTQMKKTLTGKHISSRDKGRPPSGHSDLAKTSMPALGANTASGLQYCRQDGPASFCCPRCNKVYLKAKDLDIHLSYCSS